MKDKLNTISQAAAQVMSEAYWRKKVWLKEIRHIKIGRRVFIPQSTIDKLLADGAIEPEGK